MNSGIFFLSFINKMLKYGFRRGLPICSNCCIILISEWDPFKSKETPILKQPETEAVIISQLGVSDTLC